MAAGATLSQRTQAGAGGVVLLDGRVLLIRKRLNGEWRLPKGRLDAGEKPLDAALREVAEETGFADLVPTASLGTRRVEYHLDGRLISRELTWFVFGLASWRRCPRDRRDARRFSVHWVSIDEARERLTFDEERQWLREAISATA